MSKGADTRERILDLAFRLSARDGLEGLSLGALASELGVSKSGLFAHFRSKEELQVETLRAAAAHFTARVMAPALARPRGLPRVRAIFDLWLRWTSDPALPGGCPFMAAAAELDDREGPARDFLVASEQELLAAIARAARIAVEERHFRRGLDCDQFAFDFHALLLGYNFARRLLRDPKAGRRVSASFNRLLDAAAAAA